MTAPARDARAVATRVLFRVAERGAWAAPTLDAEIARAGLDARDAALATEIVYGTLRTLPFVDAKIVGRLDRPDRRIDGWARAALRGALYQLAYLERVPAFAIVDETVRVVRQERGAKLAGFVNAILRAIVRTSPTAEERARPERMTLPGWLEDALVRSLGAERAAKFGARSAWPPPIGLRPRGARAAVADDLRLWCPAAEVLEGEIGHMALLLRGGGDPRRLPGYEEGRFAVQEQGAQVVTELLGASAGERIADACAGHGTKTAYLADLVGPEGHVVAIDLHESKLERIAPELRRLGLEVTRVTCEAIDLTVGTGGYDGSFDRVLVDAPCSGLGTVHRRPELLLRVGPADVARMAALQVEILRNAADLVRPGGTLLFAVCSPLREEGSDVVDAVLAARPDLALETGPTPDGSPDPDADGIVRIGPWLAESDAYQIARFRRRQ
jgi:16S rRNA (cytosine967-C5)-methyltransferase